MDRAITIQIVGWNSEADLRDSLTNIGSISSDQLIVRYIDNGSKDNSVSLVKELMPNADIVRLENNCGFGAAHNIGFKKCTTPLVLVLNPDLVLNWDGIVEVAKVFDNDKVGAAQGLLIKDKATNIIDSAGIVKTLSLNGRERGAGQINVNQYNKTERVLAVTGAAGLYRIVALRSIAYKNTEIFDEDFFAYKEDVDLGWRLNNAGWDVCFIPILSGWHNRKVKNEGKYGWKISIKSIKSRLGDRRSYLSFRNWIWMIVKNANFAELFWHEIFIDLRAGMFIVLSVFHLRFLKVWFEIWRGLPLMFEKKKAMRLVDSKKY